MRRPNRFDREHMHPSDVLAHNELAPATSCGKAGDGCGTRHADRSLRIVWAHVLMGPTVLVNHKAPSGPAVMPLSWAIPGPVWLVTTPVVVIRPTESTGELINHSAPSGPAVIPTGVSMLAFV